MSSFLSQLMVVPTSSSLHFHVPTNTTSNATELTSLNDITITHVSATIATTTATKTQVTATRTATTNMPKYQIDKCKATRTQHKTRSPSILHLAKKAANYATQRNLLLFFIRNDPAIMISSLLLPRDSARPSITTATNATFSLQSIDESFSTGAEQVASATIHIDSFKLIDALASEGAIFAPYVFENVFIPTNKSNHEGAWAQETSCQTSKLIVIYFKRFLYFRKDCGIFCEGEWEQQQQLDEHTNRLVGLIGFISLFDFIGVVGLLGLDRLVGIVGLSCLDDFIGLIDIVKIIKLGIYGCNGLIGYISIVSQVGLVGLVDLGFIGLVSYSAGFGLVGHTGLGFDGISLVGIGLFGINGLISVGFVSIVSFISLVDVGFIGLLGLSASLTLLA